MNEGEEFHYTIKEREKKEGKEIKQVKRKEKDWKIDCILCTLHDEI